MKWKTLDYLLLCTYHYVTETIVRWFGCIEARASLIISEYSIKFRAFLEGHSEEQVEVDSTEKGDEIGHGIMTFTDSEISA
jgi:hypothetical protein